MEPRKTEHLEVPAGLAAEIESAAEEDKRSTSELVREAVEQYLENRRWQRLLAYGEERARTLGLTEADVPRVIAESRRESAGPGL
jgi:metal-responsive CopG/Arc/MetJ family transcriptional regulator